METGDLAVVIPTHGRWPVLLETLTALDDQAGHAEVIVVVDGMDLDPPAFPRGHTIRVPHGGPAAARNAGVAATERPLVLFLGDDMVPTPGLIAAHLRAHRQAGTGIDSDHTAVLGRVVWHPTTAGNPVNRWLDWSGTQFEFAALDAERSAGSTDAGFGRFYSCNVSVSRDLFERVGGFDPEFAFYYEDLDLGWRLSQAGMRLRYEPTALVHHRHPYTVPDVVRRFEGIAVGERMMADKHPWFEPYFRRRVLSVAGDPEVSRWWVRLADRGDRLPDVLRRRVRAKANAWYLQHVGPPFLDAWYRDIELDELRRYLGDDFDEDVLAHHRDAVEDEEAAAPSEQEFFRTSRAYLYDLTAFALSGTKRPYLRLLRRLAPPGGRILEYGCGIGSDGLRLLDEGYIVAFADFDNPSTAYLRWRLDQRGHAAAVHDVDGVVPGGHDVVFCFDVLEHVDEPVAVLERLRGLGRTVICNLLTHDPDDTDLHRPLDVDGILEWARGAGLRHHSVHHGRSHLIAFDGHDAGPDTRR